MTAPRDCRPPPGTPDGTVCVLAWDVLHDKATWFGGNWVMLDTQQIMSPEYAYESGHRFHSIAEPPHD